MSAQAVREAAWKQLEAIAYPDSRYHLDFAEFIPGYPGCEDAPAAIATLPFWQDPGTLFVTPDGSTQPLREALLVAGRPMLTVTHGGRRGFRYFPARSVPHRDAAFAATLDGAERFGEQITTAAGLRDLQPLAWLATGCSAVSANGIRFGKGHGYFDTEWGIFTELGLADDHTPVAAVIHDVQFVQEDLPAGPQDTAVDWIITPTRAFRVAHRHPKPHGVRWEQVTRETLEVTPVLADMAEERARA